MNLIRDKYSTLAPRSEFLHDVVVLAQAWKKSHTYIRRHNWYADTLELDCSAVDLDKKLSTWSRELRRGIYKPSPAWLVPAPKNAAWVFGRGQQNRWGPVQALDPNYLRPLAHLGIREQTIATAIMLCLADAIETAQGDPSTNPLDAAKEGVFSYGNRLYCNWPHGAKRAHFPWGNSNTYSRYFQDYQRFVQRSSAIAQEISASRKSTTGIYIVKLDLSAFYDNVDIPRLVRRLKNEYRKFRGDNTSMPPADQKFWKLAQQSLRFFWRRDDYQFATLFKGNRLPHGLPQGMVASGFFANAYLLEFDRSIGRAIGLKDISSGKVKFVLHDYCRYVDDLRLVITVEDDDVSESRIASTVTKWVQARLRKTTPSTNKKAQLEINAAKTEIEPYSSVGGESGTAARMKSLQQELSGPFDMATLQQVETGLSGLLALAELGLREQAPSAAGDSSEPMALASIARPKLEVRDDTLTRFSAYRLVKSLRMRRRMTDLSVTEETGLARDVLLHDFELAARRLIAAWSANPSLVQVLRYALDLFPSTEVLEPVTGALLERLTESQETAYERFVVLYVLAELLRAGATETGHQASRDLSFQVGNIEAYRQHLKKIAVSLLDNTTTPWYVQQQAALFLATLNYAYSGLPLTQETVAYRTLHEYMAAESIARALHFDQEIAISLVGHQLIGDSQHYIRWFRRFALGRGRYSVRSALELLGQMNPDLLRQLTFGRGRTAAKSEALPNYLRNYFDATTPARSSELPINEWIPLAVIITHNTAPFRQENSLLQLAKVLGTLLRRYPGIDPERLTPLTVELRCSNWDILSDPRSEALIGRFKPKRGSKDPRYRTPPWCESKLAWMYAIGRLLRAAATREFDFTARYWIVREEVGWYRGIHSTWHKRRFGMLHTPNALAGTGAAITPWFSELLLRLLRWPGISADSESQSNFSSIFSIADFERAILERLNHQDTIYGRSSSLPIYLYPVQWELRRPRQLRVVILQGLMLRTIDFANGIEAVGEAGLRERHRNHTSAMLHLAYKKIQARDSVLGKQEKPTVDIVIFPEYSIHTDDQDLMRGFSDATGALLFYGLIGAVEPGTSRPVNAGRWLVPQRRGGRRSWIEVDQGKQYLTENERKLGVLAWRPHQVIIELRWGEESGFRISGAICYDATDLSLAADLKNRSHMFVIPSLNRDVKTFDGMVGALRYHMYQHVIIANTGEFGGSTAQAPYSQEYKKLISHSHGAEQISISVFDVNVDHFGPALTAPTASIAVDPYQQLGKTPPAGLNR